MVLDDWQRIEKVVRWAGLSVNAFALHIGLHRGENLYQIKRGNNGISKELAELIVARYPEISRAWLVTGEGEMFAGGIAVRSMIPVYDTDVICLAQMERLPRGRLSCRGRGRCRSLHRCSTGPWSPTCPTERCCCWRPWSLPTCCPATPTWS